VPALDLRGKHLDQGQQPVLTGCALHDLVHMCGAFILSDWRFRDDLTGTRLTATAGPSVTRVLPLGGTISQHRHPPSQPPFVIAENKRIKVPKSGCPSLSHRLLGSYQSEAEQGIAQERTCGFN